MRPRACAGKSSRSSAIVKSGGRFDSLRQLAEVPGLCGTLDDATLANLTV
ncbi:hypothetical protein HMP06_0916 [Sphingomonas sp. HMP6]|nr:hypothetical protein HMP06_0916 [Sphingomonas sp. HMP6]